MSSQPKQFKANQEYIEEQQKVNELTLIIQQQEEIRKLKEQLENQSHTSLLEKQQQEIEALRRTNAKFLTNITEPVFTVNPVQTLPTPRKLDLSMKNNTEPPPEQEDDFTKYVKSKVSSRTTSDWDKICIRGADTFVLEWSTVMRKYRPVGVDASVSLKERDIYNFFVNENFEDDEANLAAQYIVEKLSLRKEYIEAQKKLKAKEVKEQKELNDRVSGYKNKPTVRLGSLLNDLYSFELYITNRNVLPGDILPLLATCVDEDKSDEVMKTLGSINVSWNDCKSDILFLLDNTKTVAYYKQELLALRPKSGESVYKYHKRFMAYVSILKLDLIEARDIFILTLPDYVRRKIYEATAPRPGFSQPEWNLLDVMKYLEKVFTPHEDSTYLKSNATPKTMIAQAFDSVRKNRLMDKSKRSNRFKQQSKEKKEEADHSHVIHCYKCNKKAAKDNGGHYQPACPEKEGSIVNGNLVKENKYKPEGEKKRPFSGKFIKNKTMPNRKMMRVNKMEFIQVKKGDAIAPAANSDTEESSIYIHDATDEESDEEDEDESMNDSNKLDSDNDVMYEDLQYADATINGLSTRALVDKGAQLSVISLEFLMKSIRETKNKVSLNKKADILVRFPDKRTVKCMSARMKVDYKGTSIEHTFVVMQELDEDVIFGRPICKIFHIKDIYETLPDISNDTVEEFLKKYAPTPIDEVINRDYEEDQRGVKYHPEAKKYLELIAKYLQANAATIDKHSTIGTIGIRFTDKESRRKGSWSRSYHPLEAELRFHEVVKEWIRDKIVEEMVDLDSHRTVDEKDLGLFNTNWFLIMKGKPRFVFNFIPINKLIEDDTNDVPGIDEVFKKVGSSGAHIFSKLDLKSAYHQICLKPEDKSITGFTCLGKRYRFITAPLGLKHIPSIFQRMIKALLQACGLSDFACNHVDDIIIYSKTLDEHVVHVQKVLDALTSVNLTIQPAKCNFFATKVPLLGFWIEQGGMRPNVDKLCNMLNTPERPNTRKKIQRFVGFINFFRRFIPHATDLLYPIMSMKQKSFNWEDYPELEEAYKKIYDALITNVPFLHYPDPNVVLELATDASDVGIGGALYQVIDGEKRYLGFHSRVFTKSEKLYFTPKKELLSIIVHINYYRHHLLGRYFKLHTDAKSLTNIIRTLEQPNTKDSILAGWVATISEFSFEVHHIKGEDNVLPDLLSRLNKITTNTHKRPVSAQREKEIIEEAHQSHWGANGMYNYIRINHSDVLIKNAMQKCLDYIKQCDICQKVNGHRIGYAPLQEPKFCMPGEHIHIDIMFLPESLKGYTQLLVMVDKFTRFVWLKPVLSKEKEAVSQAILEVFLSYGFPSTIKSDQGNEFVNSAVQEVCKLAGTQHNKVVAYNHHANGLVESQNKTIRTTLKKMEMSFHDKKYKGRWDELVPACMFAMNSRIHSEILASPFSLMFGRSPFNFANTSEKDEKALQDDRKKMQQFWNTHKEIVPTLIHKMRVDKFEKSKYHKKTSEFNVGDQVVLRNPKKRKGDELYEGPYEVIGTTDVNGEYIIKSDYEKGLKVPANYLKRTKLDGDLLNRPAYQEQIDEDEELDETGIDDLSQESYVPKAVVTTSVNDDSLASGRVTRKRIIRKPSEAKQ